MGVSKMLREKLLAGERVYGTMGRIVKNPAINFIVKNAGLDFIMYDGEHSCFEMETLHDLFLSAKALGISGLVRVPELTKDWVSRVLDQGADGLMVPMIDTAEQAKELVRLARYQPLGERGFGSNLSRDGYMAGSTLDLMKHSNETVFVIAQIETGKAVENVEEIAAVDGIDCLLVGPADLSCSLGFPGDAMNPKEVEAIAKVAAACKKNNKVFALPGPLPMVERFKDDTKMIMLNTDTGMLIAGMKKVLSDCESIGVR